MFDYVFVSNLPSFYKVRLWNEIAKRKKIMAFFFNIDDGTRNADFTSEVPVFQYEIIEGGEISASIKIAFRILKISYNKLVVTGWENLPMLTAPFVSLKSKNIIICESSIYEYRKSLIKDLIKRCFLNRFHIAYPAGAPHKKLLDVLGYRGECKISGGCGLLNYINQPAFFPKNEVKNFLYVGRLVEVKNLKLLVRTFNGLGDKSLIIAGEGPLASYLKKIANSNITFVGYVPNQRMSQLYQTADVLVLPSKSETWGLVVEEALNCGIPVIVSDAVGCREDIVQESVGLIFDHNSMSSLVTAIHTMSDVKIYNKMRENISKMNFQDRALHQIFMY